MSSQQIHPHRVTKPIQLVAAWLVGLVLVDGMFLGAASALNEERWPHAALVIAAILNVPIFLSAIFLLQTRFRAELQEDSFYSDYLNKKTSSAVRLDKNAEQDHRILDLTRTVDELKSSMSSLASMKEDLTKLGRRTDWSLWTIGLNALHPDADKIEEDLSSAGIKVSERFATGEEATPPKKWVISLSHRLPLELQVHILRVLLKYRFDGFQQWKPDRESGEYEDVYIGSYGNDSYVPVERRFAELLNKEDAVDTLAAIYRGRIVDA